MSLSTDCLSALCVCPLDGLFNRLFVCLPACLPVCLSVCLYVRLSVCLCVCLCGYLLVALFGCLLYQQQTAPLANTMLAALLMRGINPSVSCVTMP